MDDTRKSLTFKRILKERKLNVKNPLDSPKTPETADVVQDQIKEEVPHKKIKFRRLIRRKPKKADMNPYEQSLFTLEEMKNRYHLKSHRFFPKY